MTAGRSRRPERQAPGRSRWRTVARSPRDRSGSSGSGNRPFRRSDGRRSGWRRSGERGGCGAGRPWAGPRALRRTATAPASLPAAFIPAVLSAQDRRDVGAGDADVAHHALVQTVQLGFGRATPPDALDATEQGAQPRTRPARTEPVRAPHVAADVERAVAHATDATRAASRSGTRPASGAVPSGRACVVGTRHRPPARAGRREAARGAAAVWVAAGRSAVMRRSVG